jgi:hypothetical protein
MRLSKDLIHRSRQEPCLAADEGHTAHGDEVAGEQAWIGPFLLLLSPPKVRFKLP